MTVGIILIKQDKDYRLSVLPTEPDRAGSVEKTGLVDSPCKVLNCMDYVVRLYTQV